MTMDLRLYVTFPAHRKTRRLRRKLGPAGVLALIQLWMDAAAHRPLGRLDGYTSEDVALAADWDGDAEELTSALLEIGWLDRGEDGVLEIHDWEQHQPWVVGAPDRSRRASEAAQARWRKDRDAGRQGPRLIREAAPPPESAPESESEARGHPSTDADSMRPACDPHATRNAPLLSSPLLPSPIRNGEHAHRAAESVVEEGADTRPVGFQSFLRVEAPGFAGDPDEALRAWMECGCEPHTSLLIETRRFEVDQWRTYIAQKEKGNEERFVPRPPNAAKWLRRGEWRRRSGIH